jgi:hypothetical protein
MKRYRVYWKTWGGNSQNAKIVNFEKLDSLLLDFVKLGLERGYHVSIHDREKPDDELKFDLEEEENG